MKLRVFAEDLEEDRRVDVVGHLRAAGAEPPTLAVVVQSPDRERVREAAAGMIAAGRAAAAELGMDDEVEELAASIRVEQLAAAA